MASTVEQRTLRSRKQKVSGLRRLCPNYKIVFEETLNTTDVPFLLSRCWHPDPSQIQMMFTRIRDWNDAKSIASSFVGLYWDLTTHCSLLSEDGQVDAIWISRSTDENFDLTGWGVSRQADDLFYFQHGFSGKKGENRALKCFRGTESMEYHPIRNPQENAFFNAPYFPIEPETRGYLLLKRAEPWDEACQAYCMLFCDESSEFDHNHLIDCLSDPSIATRLKAITLCPFKADSTHGRCEFAEDDATAVEGWVKALCGDENTTMDWVQTIVESEDGQWITRWHLNFN